MRMSSCLCREFCLKEDCFMLYRVPLLFAPQPEGGFTVTSPALPELVSEGDTLAEAFANAQDALAAVIELYTDQGRPLPPGVTLPTPGQLIWADALVKTTSIT